MVFMLISGLIPGGGVSVIDPMVEKYMCRLSTENPQLYELMKRDRVQRFALCHNKYEVKRSVPAGLSVPPDRADAPVLSDRFSSLPAPDVDKGLFRLDDVETSFSLVSQTVLTPPPKFAGLY